MAAPVGVPRRRDRLGEVGCHRQLHVHDAVPSHSLTLRQLLEEGRLHAERLALLVESNQGGVG